MNFKRKKITKTSNSLLHQYDVEIAAIKLKKTLIKQGIITSNSFTAKEGILFFKLLFFFNIKIKLINKMQKQIYYTAKKKIHLNNTNQMYLFKWKKVSLIKVA